MATYGGKRKGAGRKKGVSGNKPRIMDYFKPDEIEGLIKVAKKKAKKDPKILMFLLEQYFGKAHQRLELGGEGGAPIQFIMAPEILEKHKNK